MPTSFYSLFEFSYEDELALYDRIQFRNTHSKMPAGANHGKNVGTNVKYVHNMLTTTDFSSLTVGTYPTFDAGNDIEPLIVGIL